MSTTTAAKPRPALRLNQKAVLIATARFQEWHDQAIQTPGLSNLDRDLLDVIAGYYRRLLAEAFAGGLSAERLADKTGADPRSIRASIKRLVGLALLGVKPGRGAYANEYLPALPKRLVAAMTTAAAEDAPPL